MPLYKIGAGAMPTNNNVESLHQQYYSDCLQVHIEAIELCLDEGLAVGADYGVEFDLDGLMRMDTVSRIASLKEAVSGAIMAPDEARLKLNLPPVPGGKYPLIQQQNYSLEAIGKRDAQADPFGMSKPPPPPAPTPAPVPPEPAPAATPAPAGSKDLAAEFQLQARELVASTEAAMQALIASARGDAAAGVRAVETAAQAAVGTLTDAATGLREQTAQAAAAQQRAAESMVAAEAALAEARSLLTQRQAEPPTPAPAPEAAPEAAELLADAFLQLLAAEPVDG
jgi:hypothetical protein